MIDAAAFVAAHAQRPDAPVLVNDQPAASTAPISASEFMVALAPRSDASASASAQASAPSVTINAAEFVDAHYQNDPTALKFTRRVESAEPKAGDRVLAKTSYPSKRLSLQNGHYQVVDHDK